MFAYERGKTVSNADGAAPLVLSPLLGWVDGGLLTEGFFKGLKQFLRKCLHLRLVHLQHLSVLGEKSVGLVLDVADLCIDGSAQPLSDGGEDLVAIEIEQALLE